MAIDDLFQLLLQNGEIVENDAMLNFDVRLDRFVEITCVVTIDSAGVDAAIDAQERHTYVFIVILRERPETTMGVPILRTDSGMHDKCPVSRDRVDFFLQERLTSSDHEIRTGGPDKLRGFAAVRTGRLENRHRRFQARVTFTDF